MTTTSVTVRRPADFPSVTAAYHQLRYGVPGPSTLEVTVSPGVYDGGLLAVEDPAFDGQVAVVVRGGPGVVLRDTQVHLAGTSVTVSGLRYDRVKASGVALRVQATKHLVVERVAFLDARIGSVGGFGSMVGTALLLAEARGPGVTATVDGLWIVGARHVTGGPLVFLTEQEGTFASVTLRRFAAIGLAGAPLVVNSSGPVTVTDGAVVVPEGQHLVSSPRPRTGLHVAGGRFVLDHEAAFLGAQTAPGREALEYAPARVTNARVGVRGGAPFDHDPGAVLDDCAVVTPAAVDEAAWRRLAESMATPDPATLLP